MLVLSYLPRIITPLADVLPGGNRWIQGHFDVYKTRLSVNSGLELRHLSLLPSGRKEGLKDDSVALTNMPHASVDTAYPAGISLHVNDGPLKLDDIALLQSSYPSEPMDQLRERYRREGYLFLKGLLPREDVFSARESYFNDMSPSGVLEPGSAPVEGIFNSSASAADYPGIGAGSVKNARPGETDKSAVFTELALKAHTSKWYEGSEAGGELGFANHPALTEFVSQFTQWGDDTLPVKRSLLRNNTPGNRAIGVHYDQTFMRYGEPTSVTAWVPIGDVKIDGGGLIYLEGGMLQ